jgi:signal peptidase I
MLMVSVEVQVPGLANQLPAERAMRALPGQAEAGCLVDPSRRHQYVVGPERHTPISQLPCPLNAGIDEASGDAVVTERILARDAKHGEVITFTDPSREGRTVTHRVVSVRDQGDRLAFHTRGDANGKGERWTIASDGSVGRVLRVVPDAGYVLHWFRQPSVRFVCLTLASLLLAGLVLARVWGIGAGRRA